MRKVFLILFILQLFGSSRVKAQTHRIHQLRETVYSSNGRKQYDALFQLFEHRYSMPVETLAVYLNMAQKLGSDTVSLETQFTFELIKLMRDGRTFSPVSLISRADSMLQLIQREKLKTDFELRFMHFKASMLVRIGRYKESLEEYYKVLKLAEQRNNIEYICASWNGIGWVHLETEKYNEAINYLRKVINLVVDTAYNGRPNVIYNNLASCYASIGQNDSALKYILRSEKNVRAVESLQLLANALAIKSDILKAMGRKQEAVACLNEMVDTRKKIGDVFYIVSDMFLLAKYYAENGDCQKGIAVCKEALSLIEKHNIQVKEMIIREALALNYKVCGDFKLYAAQLELLMNLKDSMNKNVSADALAEMQTRYEMEKKEEQIVRQELLLSRRNYLVYGSVTLLVMAILIGVQYFRYYKHRSVTESLLAVAEAREEERKRIAAELHDNIGTQLGFVSRKIENYNSKKWTDPQTERRLLEEISSASRRTIGDLRETIWALKKEQVDFRELADRLKLFLRRQFEDQQETQIDISEDIRHAIVLSPVESLNVFRIVQEALHNASMHAKATKVKLSFASDDKENWRIEIEDNGVGFDEAQTFEDHYGMDNMRERARESGLRLQIKSGKNSGTCISLSREPA